MPRASVLPFLGFVLVLVCSCATGSGNGGPSGAPLPERFAMPEQPFDRLEQQEGTIYSEQRPLDIYRDRRARAIGDLVLVKIVESSSGAKKAETKTERSSTITAKADNLLGYETALSEMNRRFKPESAISGGLSNTFDGTGETTRDSKVTATLTARVVDVTPEGNLLIRGYREVRVNNETQHIILSGMVRPADISPDNSIASSYVADARIEYSGRGVLSDKQQPGWLGRTLDVVWPF